jgi:succinate-acetate transporter protein
MKITKYLKWLPIALLAIFFLASCTAGNEKFDIDPAGFWMGLWHGFISLVTFIISIFNDNVTIYEVNNNGWTYNLGFILGISIFYGGSSKGTCRRRR